MTTPINRLAFALKQIEQSRRVVATSPNLKRRDIDFVYQGLFLFAVKKFEAFLEDQLVGLAAGSVTWAPRLIDGKMRSVRPTLKGATESTIRAIMLGSTDYLKLLPIHHCTNAASPFLKDGFPFSLIVDDDRARLTRCLAVRNLIAHDSAAARLKFEKVVLGQIPLPVYRRNAAGFLRTNFSQQQTYFETELAALLRIARVLS
jgi:hypothetical protein